MNNSSNNTILLYNQEITKDEEMLVPFADTGAILKFVSANSIPVAHFWTTPPTVILGLQDQRLKNIAGGMHRLEEKGYIYYVRNSGGLGVVTDAGILNFTLFLPNKNNITIDQAYEQMHRIMQKTFSDKIQTGEIARSYCPGTYDLSIDGKKIAGISQRRVGNAVAIMAYISVTGDQKKRSQLMKDFYEISNYPKHEHIDYPDIDVHCMTNLDEILATPLTVETAKQKILQELALDYNIDRENINIIRESLPYKDAYNQTIDDLIYKNKKLLGEI